MKIEGVTFENRRFVQGGMLLNVPAGCINLGENGIKHIYSRNNGKNIKMSYISGQSIKAKIKDHLEEKGIKLSIPKIVQEKGKKNTPTTSCNPFEYLDDDLFGYMNVIPANEKEKVDEDNKGTTRAGAFKISYFIGREGDIKNDFGVKRNGAFKDNELTTMPLTENRGFASTQYSGCFIIDLNCTGRFFKKNISGYKNLSDTFPVEHYEDKIMKNEYGEIVLKPEIRTERVQTLIESLPYLNGGAKMATIYADIAPKFVVYCVTDIGNNLFQEISNPANDFNISALREGIKDYQAHIKSNIYMAKKNGFLDTYTQEIKAFVDDFNIKTDNIQIICNEDLSGINEITKRFSKEVLAKIYYSVEGI
ncbi:MAG: type I-B CRISPR-associated protein Cas7/Cst2/DevR [Clostridia bacterium]|nr:type I-B CRISPR-associated protein Cas7/Cst2/DevR [Clostridia bacterium]